jgi:hypothetical protein
MDNDKSLTTNTIIDTVDPSDTVSISEAMLPLYNDGNRAIYLRYRICCFSVKEATQLAGITHWTVERWRQDPAFLKLDTEEMPRLQKELSAKYLSMEYTRNFTVILRRDLRILMKDLMAAQDEDSPQLTKEENDYLNKIRPMYSPQQLSIVQQLVGGAKETAFNFSEFTLRFERTRGEVQIRNNNDGG